MQSLHIYTTAIVQSYSPSPSSCTLTITSVHRARNDADMPPELLNEVIHELCDEDDILNARKQTKHVLGLISLTCRHFAEPLRPTIFAHIRLKSRDDLLTLISFLDSPTSRIKDYIKEIEVKEYEPCEPWLHLLHTSLMCRLPHAKIERLSLISKESSPTAMKLRSIHGGSPRSIPPACWRIDDLRLDNLRLDSFGHMVKLVAGLPHLSHLECKKIGLAQRSTRFSPSSLSI